jgi:hypothetical protein
MRRGARAALAALAFLIPLLPVAAQQAGFRPIPLTVTPVSTFLHGSAATAFGKLEFRGGLQLASADPDFGSLSGLDVAPDGRTLYAIADNGFWFTATLVEDDGRLTGLAGGRLAPILDRNGQVVSTKRLGDAEGLRLTEANGRLAALVSFEQVNNVREYLGPDFGRAASRPLKLPAMVAGMKKNKGLESVAVATPAAGLGDAIVLVAERSLDPGGNNRAWIVGGPHEGAFSIVRSKGYDVTDAAFMPGGDLLILERKVDFPSGLYARIRRLPGRSIRPGATVDGDTLLEADLRYQIDNMEGLAVRGGPGGETLIDIVSDDNQNRLQRTLLLQFALPAP